MPLNKLVEPESMPARLSAFAAVMMGWSCVRNEASAGSALKSLLRFPRSFCASSNSGGEVADWSDAIVVPKSERTDASDELSAASGGDRRRGYRGGLCRLHEQVDFVGRGDTHRRRPKAGADRRRQRLVAAPPMSRA